MTHEQALIPYFLAKRGNKSLENILSIFAGIISLSLLAQVTLVLPWTPVPLTGQTFGVLLMALLWGRKRGLAVILSYLTLGAIGLPLFALGKSGISMGPTLGYLIGMLVATYWIGLLSDKGWTKTFGRCLLASLSGSVIIYFFGSLILAYFIPAKDVFKLGVWPFLLGDFFKLFLASLIAYKSQPIKNESPEVIS